MKVIFSLLFMLVTMVTFSQSGSIKGNIKDNLGEPIFGANIYTENQQGTTSDFDGNYKLELPEGTYRITISSLGYQDTTFNITISSGTSITRNVTLYEKAELITEIEVTSATRRNIAPEKEVITIESLSPELLNNNNITNGADAVERVAGVTVLDGQASIRGGSGYAYGTGSRVILVVDEIPMLTPERYEVPWDFMPIENIQGVDVVKGASSVQYGTSALNGIINVNSKWPSKEKETEINSFVTLYNAPPEPIEDAKWWSYTQSDDKEDRFRSAPHYLGLQAMHRRKINDADIAVGGSMISNQTHIQSQKINKIRAIANWRIKPERVEGLVVGMYNNVFYRNKDNMFIWNGFDEGAFNGESFEDKYIRASFDPYVKYFFKKNNEINLLNRVYYDQRISSSRGDYYGWKVYNDLQYRRTFKNKAKEISASVQVGVVNDRTGIQAISFKSFDADSTGLFNFNTFATYLQGDIGWRGLTVAAGARYDRINLDGSKTQSKPVFNAGASYEFLKKNYVRFSFGQSFRIPSIAERYVFEEITQVDFSGIPITVYAGPNPDLKPETGYSFEMGYKKLFKVNRWKAEFDAIVFYQRFDDMIEFTFNLAHEDLLGETPTGSYTGFRPENVSDARIFGWEFLFRGMYEFKKDINLSYQMGYTYNYAANGDVIEEATKIGKLIKNAFKAYTISDEEFEEYNDYSYNPLTDRSYDAADSASILHGMLNYRFRHSFNADINLNYKKYTIGTNLRFYSFMDKIDIPLQENIPGVDDFVDSKEFTGDWVVDLRATYHINEHFNVGMVFKNVFNNLYALRPAKPNEPRTYTLQANVKF